MPSEREATEAKRTRHDRDVTGTAGPAAGVKLFVADQTFVNIGYRYNWYFYSFEAAKNNITHGNRYY
jgi:hypothetical protein